MPIFRILARQDALLLDTETYDVIGDTPKDAANKLARHQSAAQLSDEDVQLTILDGITRVVKEDDGVPIHTVRVLRPVKVVDEKDTYILLDENNMAIGQYLEIDWDLTDEEEEVAIPTDVQELLIESDNEP